jgi:hypothetical protein
MWYFVCSLYIFYFSCVHTFSLVKNVPLSVALAICHKAARDHHAVHSIWQSPDLVGDPSQCQQLIIIPQQQRSKTELNVDLLHVTYYWVIMKLWHRSVARLGRPTPGLGLALYQRI